MCARYMPVQIIFAPVPQAGFTLKAGLEQPILNNYDPYCIHLPNEIVTEFL
jgi:hypothetical protein